MLHGNLTVITRPMFAGKTEQMLKEILFAASPAYGYEEFATRFAVYVPATATRFAERSVVSHTMRSYPAIPVSRIEDIDPGDATIVFFDEIQFFTEPDVSGSVVECVRALRANGVDVFCAGLDMDYLGRAFEVTASLLAEASELRRLTARCSHCPAEATHTARLRGGMPRLAAGGAQVYASMCREHWFEHVRSGEGEA